MKLDIPNARPLQEDGMFCGPWMSLLTKIRIWIVANSQYGTTAQRPTKGLQPGDKYLDFTLGANGRPVFIGKDGVTWVDPGAGGGGGITQLTGDVTAGPGAGAQVAAISAGVVSYAKMQNVSATSRFLGRITAGAGSTEELTGTQATTLLDAFTSTLKGLAPSSGGGTANFLRADGTWAAPPAGGAVPTGTGFRHITAGVEDAASKTVDLSTAADAVGILAAGRFPALTGDVTTVAGALATTIAANAVTNAKAAQMAANTIKGNNTAGLANAVDLTVAQTKTLLGYTLASADYANQGTVTTVLHGNAAGNPSFGAVSLTADVSGILPVANGGTGSATKATALARKTADQSITSSIVLTNDTHLSFAIAANEEWVATFYLDAGDALGTTGLDLAITTPAGATQNISVSIIAGSTGVALASRTTVSGAAIPFTTLALTAGATTGQLVMMVWVLNGATPGTVQLQFAQDTSSVTAITLKKGSYMTAFRVA